MKVLIIGYGSIGKRHDSVLSEFEKVTSIDIVTKQSLSHRTTFTTLQDVNNLISYDYFIIASQTNRHYKELQYLELNVVGKLIFCEKPLFKTLKPLNIVNNRVYVGYVLRFHPLLKKLQELVEDEKIININIRCGQYLPTWREYGDYRESYSAKKEHGGGVLLDLSHEIDYLQYLCGKMDEIKSYQVKISDLEIDSDDFTTFIGKTDRGTLVNLSIDYISKITHRSIFLNTIQNTYELNFIENRLIQKGISGDASVFKSDDLERNSMFISMHSSILNKKESACSYEEAVAVMQTIKVVQEQNHE